MDELQGEFSQQRECFFPLERSDFVFRIAQGRKLGFRFTQPKIGDVWNCVVQCVNRLGFRICFTNPELSKVDELGEFYD